MNEEIGVSLKDINLALKHNTDDKVSDVRQGLNFDHIYRIGSHRMATVTVTRNVDRELCVTMKCLHCNKVVFNGVASELAGIFRLVPREGNGKQRGSFSSDRNDMRGGIQRRFQQQNDSNRYDSGRVHGKDDRSCESQGSEHVPTESKTI